MNTKRMTTILLLFTLLFIPTACSYFKGGGSNGAIKIGIPAPLSQGSAEYGEFMRQGATLAADEINANGGINGRKLELVFEDSQGQPAEATNAAERLLVRDQVNVITDAFNSSATLAVAEVAQRENAPMVVGLSTADAITIPGRPNLFRVCAPNTRLAELLSDYIVQHNKPATVAYVYEKTDFGTNLANVVRQRLEQAGVQTVAYEGINQHDTDFLSLISKLKPLKPEMVFFAVIADSALPFLRQAQQADFHARWANAVSLSNPKFLQDAGSLTDGFIGITHFEATTAQGAAKTFVDNFKAKYGQIPTHYSAVYYDTIRVIADAIRRGGVERQGIINALKTTDFQGITGHIRFNSNGQANIGTVIFRWANNNKEVLQVNQGD
jgi:branched-chain amino acid transport system substrate-binding protein